MKYLLVVAHPDDEVLGAGASMWRWSHEGDMVDVAIMCTEAKARAFRPEDKELNDDLNASSDFLGIHKKYEATFPNIEMNTVPHLKLVQFIESTFVKVSLILSSLIILQTQIMTIFRHQWLVRRQFVCFSASQV